MILDNFLKFSQNNNEYVRPMKISNQNDLKYLKKS